ncbi:MAG: ATP-dependent Clp protease ATP-binding subunit [Patescibacteria group bacterium]
MQPWEILDKFTGHLRDVLARSIALATEVGSPTVAPLHLLYSLAMQKGSVAHEILTKSNITPETIQSFILAMPREAHPAPPVGSSPTATIPELDTDAKRILERAMLTAHDYEHAHVGTEHLLSAILQLKDERIKTLLDDLRVPSKRLKTQLDHVLESISQFPDIPDADEHHHHDHPIPLPAKEKTTEVKTQKKDRKLLEYFARELTSPEVQKTIDTVVGRADEIDRLVHVLARRTKNNPVLLGEPGVGKTAIVEGLAKKIVAGDVPDVLLGKHIFALDMGLVVAGTIYRGEFEARLKQIVDDIKSDPESILFIDEIHTIVGTGSSQGSLDAANILKPALARGELRCIGATTMEEYKKYIESDAALERRFQPVVVDEPTAEKTYAILRGIRAHYEQFHGVHITDGALHAAAELADQFIHTSHLPDKAIDLVDEAAAAVRVRARHDRAARALHELRERIDALHREKETAIYNEQFDRALACKAEEQALTRKLNLLSRRATRATQRRPRVTDTDIAQVVARITGVPFEHLLHRGQAQYQQLETELKKHIVGQDEPIALLANRFRVAAAGLQDPRRPFASFLFVGPSGVGKTELARQLAATIYPGRKALLRLDMSEFAEGYSISKLLGSPAGYIGYREATPLLDRLKYHPNSIILFDNIDKAHRDVLNLLLQILEEGEIASATGKTISFKHATIILTLAAEKRFFITDSIGFAGDRAAPSANLPTNLESWLKEVLSDELLGRLDAIVPFRPLSREDLTAIIRLHIDALNKRLAVHARTLTVSDAVIDHLLSTIREIEGARPVKQAVARELEHKLTQRLLQTTSSTMSADVASGAIVVQ